MNSPVKLIIAGGRNFTDYELMRQSIYQFMSDVDNDDITIISGNARGADKLGNKFAFEHPHIKLDIYPAWWRGENGDQPYNKAAGYQRNVRMAENATNLIAFWDGKSRGTKHMINIATHFDLITKVIRY